MEIFVNPKLQFSHKKIFLKYSMNPFKRQKKFIEKSVSNHTFFRLKSNVFRFVYVHESSMTDSFATNTKPVPHLHVCFFSHGEKGTSFKRFFHFVTGENQTEFRLSRFCTCGKQGVGSKKRSSIFPMTAMMGELIIVVTKVPRPI